MTATSADIKKEPEIIRYPAFIDNCSIVLGLHRFALVYEVNQRVKEHQRPTNAANHIKGIKSELIFSHYLHTRGISHVWTENLSNAGQAEADVLIYKENKTIRIDVKTKNIKSNEYQVNYKEHKKTKVDYYVFVECLSDHKARFITFSYNAVTNWQRKKIFSEVLYLKG